ncbi:MAG: hypothetical protein K0R09_3825, partial [Clostridiales bacterium]|nr:hypothetical protein [Clostridiales bacterium]
MLLTFISMSWLIVSFITLNSISDLERSS